MLTITITTFFIIIHPLIIHTPYCKAEIVVFKDLEREEYIFKNDKEQNEYVLPYFILEKVAPR